MERVSRLSNALAHLRVVFTSWPIIILCLII